MMIRRCIICKKTKDAYQLLRFYRDRENILQICSLRSYRPSIQVSPNVLCQPTQRSTGKRTHKSIWLCVEKGCIQILLQKQRKASFLSMYSKSHIIRQLIHVFSCELYRYMNHLYRQGGRRYIEKNVNCSEELRNYNFIFIHQEDSNLQKDEIHESQNVKNIFLYNSFFWQNTSENQHNIALYDVSKKRKHKNRRQRIQTILEIWAKLRYID